MAAWPSTLLPAGAWYWSGLPPLLLRRWSGAENSKSNADASCPVSLQVRLLTGIGRYNEMTYIFDLLHKKHYFEVLMRKKLDPVGVQCF